MEKNEILHKVSPKEEYSHHYHLESIYSLLYADDSIVVAEAPSIPNMCIVQLTQPVSSNRQYVAGKPLTIQLSPGGHWSLTRARHLENILAFRTPFFGYSSIMPVAMEVWIAFIPLLSCL